MIGSEISYTIGKAEFDDIEDLCAIQAAAIERFGKSCYSEDELYAWLSQISLQGTAQSLEDEDREIFVACDSQYGHVLGFSAVHGDQITHVYVDPAYAEEGIGSALLRRAEWHIRKEGARYVRLLSTMNSVDFYEHRGYNSLGKSRLAVNDDISLELREMRKRFKAAG